MIAFLSMVEKPYRNKIFRIADHLKITTPWQFRRYSVTRLKSAGKVGENCIIHLRMALVRCGCPYFPDDTIEALEKLLKSSRSASENKSIALRFKILSRDKFSCKYCGRSPKTDDSVVLHIDHILPLSKGGTWDESNLLTACRECNIGKNDAIIG
jgi:hypothetical protein